MPPPLRPASMDVKYTLFIIIDNEERKFMSSQKQIEANRRNAEKSTGPKTEVGKATVSKNAIKHGLLSEETRLPWEEEEELDDLRKKLADTLRPVGALEEIVVDRMISLTWRIKRASRIESGILALLKYEKSFNKAWAHYKDSYKMQPAFPSGSDMFPDKMVIPDQERFDAASQKMSAANALVNSALPELGRIFTDGAKELSTLHRYETGLERSWFKALHELQRLQTVRQGGTVPPPLAIDIHSDADCTIS